MLNLSRIAMKKIVLNVGGIKYETTRDSLTAYPESKLGKMFDPSNEEVLKPVYPGGNEYFINRNGHAFYYIMEFYRTGEVTWNEEMTVTKEFPVTKKALYLEIEYFKLPIVQKRAEKNLQKKVALIDEFINGLEGLINDTINRFVSEVDVEFYLNGETPWQNSFVEVALFKSFTKQGFGILKNDAVVEKIAKRLRKFSNA